MTAGQQEEFLEHMRAGMRRGAAAEVMDLTRMEVIAFIESQPRFQAQVLDAEALATEHVEEALYQAAVSGSVPAAKLWLELKKPGPREAARPVAADDTEAPRSNQPYDELEEMMRLTTD